MFWPHVEYEGCGGQHERRGVYFSKASTQGSLKSPGRKSLRVQSDSNGAPVKDCDRQDLVGRRVASADLAKILMGERLGREIRWVRDSAEAFRLSQAKSFYEQLNEHRELCEHAEYLVSGPLKSLPAPKVEIAIKELQDHGQVLPTDLQWQCYQKKVDAMQSNLENISANDLLNVIMPYGAPSPAFDGLCPSLSSLPGDVKTKGFTFTKTCITDVFAAMVSLEDALRDKVVSLCQEVMEYLDLHASEEGEEGASFDSYLDEVVVASRALRALGDARCAKYISSVQALAAVGAKRDKSS